MSNAGRPSVPAHMKELAGTLRKDRTRQGITFTPINIVPKPEVWLNNRAKKYFRNTCELLIGKGLLNDGNVQLVIMMAQEFATYEEATRELKKSGMTRVVGENHYEQASPWVAIRNQAFKNYKDIASLFGMDPVSSQKIGPTKSDEKDPLAALEEKYGK
jgi:P27 family predicted phage terminase small subunit